MYWNRIVISISLVLTLSSVLHAKALMPIREDELIIQGIFYDEYKAYENSYFIYKKLFDMTDEEEYLFREAKSALMSNTHIIESIERLKLWDKLHPNQIQVRRLLIPLYLTAREVEKASIEAEYLLEQSHEIIDLDLASNSFLYAGKFKRALSLLHQVYVLAPEEEILLRMVGMMDELTDERKKAIRLLETHRRMKGLSIDGHVQLIILYQKEKDVDGILETYKALYILDPKEEYVTRIIDAYLYTRDIEGAITFLEKADTQKSLLYEFYKSEKYYSKALWLVDKLYIETKEPKWLAEKAVLIFEKAYNRDDEKLIADVIYYFEKAIELGNDDSIYLNYYGYTLIDKEVNIQKGMDIIKNALIQQPDNTYYLDSLAWGYYKTRQCKKAYNTMKRVVDEEGLEEDEIIVHWLAIKQCK